MRLGLSASTPGFSAPDLIDLTVEAERLGYEEAWVAEVAGPEAFSLLGALATNTDRMNLGVAVVPAMTRSPALLAMAAATVSQLLAGREFSLGVGSSSNVIVEEWHGAEFVPPLGRVRDSVEATRALLGGEREYLGEHLTTRRFRLDSPPVGPVRLFVGALGPRMLRLAGAVGDGVCLNLMPPEAVPRQIAEVKRGAEEAGRDLPEHFRVMARFHVVLTDDVEAGRGLVRAGFGPYFAQPVYNRFLAWMGHHREAQGIAEAFARGDRAGVGAAFTDPIVDGVSLVGSPEAIRERLDEYAGVGVDIGALNFIGDAATVYSGLEQLAPSG